MDELELAYAISMHKSQGSEPLCHPLAWGLPMLMTRTFIQLLRAREMVTIVGRERVIEAMVRNNYIEKRYSELSIVLRRCLLR